MWDSGRHPVEGSVRPRHRMRRRRRRRAGDHLSHGEMRHFRISIDIAAPAERVWRVMSDTERWYEWTESITSVKLLGDGSFTVGNRALIKQPKFPPVTWTILKIEPGRSFTWASSGPGYRTVGHHLVEPIDGGCRATLLVDMEGVLGGLLGRLTRGITERYIGYEARGLKARSENPSHRRERAGLVTPEWPRVRDRFAS